VSAPAPQRRRTRRPRAEREAEILAAAREVFAEQGYAAAAVAEVASRAGVVEGTVYSYFESKRALLIAVMKGFYEELIAETERGLQAVRGTENQLRFVIRHHLDTFARDLGLCRVIVSEARPDVALYDEAILELNRRYTGLALRVLEDGVRDGTLRPDLVPSVIRDLLYGGIEHAVWRFVFTGAPLDAAAVADQLADALLSGILVRPAVSTDATEAAVIRLERAVAQLESRVAD
jgi:AcrR family transcriptional regulator